MQYKRRKQCKVLQTLLVFKILKGLAGLKGHSFYLSFL